MAPIRADVSEPMFEWDEKKRLATIEKHRIDFVEAAARIFTSDYIELPGKSDIEERRIAIGSVEQVCLAVVFTRRDDMIRIITARKARKNERERFEADVARRDAEGEGANGLGDSSRTT